MERAVQIRYIVVFICMALLAGALTLRYAEIMVFTGGGARRAAAQSGAVTTERGPILDRNGKILAIQTELNSVTAWTPDVRDPSRTAQLLADILESDEQRLSELLRESAGYVVLERGISPTQSEQIEELRAERRIPGIHLRAESGRSYPGGPTAAAALGYVGVDNTGLSGIEYAYNEVLSAPAEGRPGETRYGNQLFLTLDLNIQSMVDEIVQETLDRERARAVTMLAMDAGTGELLAYSSAPSFDPNNFTEYTSAQRQNAAITRIYEPGSVFKVFSIAAIMELGGISGQDRFHTSGGYRPESAAFEIRDIGDYGTIDTEGIIRHSSNVGAAYAAETVDAESFYHMLQMFGFGDKTGIEFSGEERGLLRQPSAWSGRTKQTIAIGQEVGVTAMQILRAATAFANHGVVLQPRIVHKVLEPDGTVIRESRRSPQRQVLSPETAQQMLTYMHSSTQPGGTAWRIQIDGIDIAAKTGTAEVFDAQIGAYSDDAYIASTLAMFPAHDPEIILYTVIEEPRGETVFGGRIAVPPVRQAAEFIIPYLGIKTDRDTVRRHPGRVAVSRPRLPEFENEIPDLTGLPKRSLLPLFDHDRIEIELEGTGWVVRQDPPPGTALREGIRLRLELE